MDNYAASVLRAVIDNAPCTKLCVKQRTGLSMSTVLRVVNDLQRQGWIQVEQMPSPYGGKPHARITLGTRHVVGAHCRQGQWTICRLSPDGTAVRQQALPPPDALCCITPDFDPIAAAQTDTAQTIDYADAMAYYWAAHDGGAWVDDTLCARQAGHPACPLAHLPSPLCANTRLCYADAFATADAQQKNRLAAELTDWLRALWRVPYVHFWYQCSIDPAEAAAWAALRKATHDYL